MEIRGVEIRKVVWTGEKVNNEGEQTQPPKLTITLEISDPVSSEIKNLVDFGQKGPCTWEVGALKRELAGVS